MNFLRIASQFNVFTRTNNLPFPVVRLTYDTITDAHRAWHILTREMGELALHPTDEKLPLGQFRAHGIDFIIEPLK